MNSMTGFGRGTGESALGIVTAEIKAVNSRFLEINIRSDHFPGVLEETARQMIKETISRGKLNISLSFTPAAGGKEMEVHLNEPLLDAYIAALVQVSKKKRVKGRIGISDLLAMPESFVSVQKKEMTEDELLPMVQQAMTEALHSLEEMRQREGNNLKADLKKRIAFLREKLNFMVSRQDLAAKAYAERLHQRMTDLLKKMNLETDESRIMEEVAIFSEKTDYTEEVVRFGSHLDQFEHMLDSNEPIGRKLDFLLQEINREVNTTASKASDTEVIDCVITVKTELEKIREQVQNIE